MGVPDTLINQWYDDYATVASTSAIAGTTSANAATAIVGVGTSFLTELRYGDEIALSSASSTYAVVTAIADDTHCTVLTALGNGTSQTITRRRYTDSNRPQDAELIGQTLSDVLRNIKSVVRNESVLKGWERLNHAVVFVESTQAQVSGVDLTNSDLVNKGVWLRQDSGDIFSWIGSLEYGGGITEINFGLPGGGLNDTFTEMITSALSIPSEGGAMPYHYREGSVTATAGATSVSVSLTPNELDASYRVFATFSDGTTVSALEVPWVRNIATTGFDLYWTTAIPGGQQITLDWLLIRNV